MPLKGVTYFFCLIGALSVPSASQGAEIPLEVVNHRLQLALKYLIKSQRPDGLFNYQYDFIRGKYLDRDNIVRQAGAGYGLAEYFSKTRDTAAKDAIVRALKAYAARSIEYGQGLVLSPDQSLSQAKTGATALALLAELFYFEASRDSQFKDVRQGWLRGLHALLRKGGGFVRKPGDLEESPYYNGEGWLAMAHYARLFPDNAEVQQVLEVVDPYLIERYGGESDIGFIHWGLMAAAVRHEVTGAKRFRDFVRDQAEAFLDRLRPALKPHANACYSVEGLIAAANVLGEEQGRNREFGERLRRRIDAEIDKSLTFQMLPGQNKLDFGHGRYLFSEQLKSFAGAFTDGLYRPRARIDYTQHCLSALLNYSLLGIAR